MASPAPLNVPIFSQLKNANVANANEEQLLFFAGLAHMMWAQYTARGHNPPPWLERRTMAIEAALTALETPVDSA